MAYETATLQLCEEQDKLYSGLLNSRNQARSKIEDLDGKLKQAEFKLGEVTEAGKKFKYELGVANTKLAIAESKVAQLSDELTRSKPEHEREFAEARDAAVKEFLNGPELRAYVEQQVFDNAPDIYSEALEHVLALNPSLPIKTEGLRPGVEVANGEIVAEDEDVEARTHGIGKDPVNVEDTFIIVENDEEELSPSSNQPLSQGVDLALIQPPPRAADLTMEETLASLDEEIAAQKANKGKGPAFDETEA